MSVIISANMISKGGRKGVNRMFSPIVNITAGIALLFAVMDAAAAEPWDDYDAANYEAAFAGYMPLAENGNAVAQFFLGSMYDNGWGVSQDYGQAVKWYRMSAEQGDSDAQLNIGYLYAKGLGVTQDLVQAHMWFALAAANGNKSAAEDRAIVTHSMTADQIAKATQLADDWTPK